MTGLRSELRVVLPRLWAGRVLPILLGASVLLVVAVRVIAPTPTGPVHSELARLLGANEIAGFVLMAVAILSAYLLVAPDLHDEFESMSAGGSSRPLTFGAARVLAGAAGLAAAATLLGIFILALDLGGAYLKEESVHLVVLFANALPVFLLALVLMCFGGRVFGLVGAFFLLSVGSDAAYQRASLADGFIEQGSLFSAEQLVAWLAPRQLMDRLQGVALTDESVALNQFPVREGHSVWGTDLIQVSGPADIAQFAAYLVVLAGLLYVACRLRARHARTRFHLVPSWLERRRG